jgi:hypothetical protein
MPMRRKRHAPVIQEGLALTGLSEEQVFETANLGEVHGGSRPSVCHTVVGSLIAGGDAPPRGDGDLCQGKL